ncbi:protein NO VEIN domain-containing protein [Janibacter terrae]|uniref:protein NO VEIN domain-containing protein n=1 Tax=Janibacter terrae TaxID=103817 RepID=UPI0031F79781
MPINEWWLGDSRERYWVEITNREDLGVNLIAPQVNDAGREEWSYELLRHVRPGDLVLHWHKESGPALVGYSHVAAPAFASSLEWQSRGTYGRTHPNVGLEDAWEVPLQGYRELASPVHLDRVRELEQELRNVRTGLESTFNGAIYFPFAISDKRPIRSAQAYLTKFPAALVDAIPELKELGQAAVDEPGDSATPRAPKSRAGAGASGYGRQPDAERRRAVERYAVEQVIKHYGDALGYMAEDVGARESWDVTLRRGDEERHIEVKGSTTDRLAIDITEGEVRHSEAISTTLVVIDQIQMDGELNCSGGRWRVWSNWTPDRSELIPTAYRHPLPGGGAEGRPTT